MKGRSTDIAHSRRVGKNWVMTGLWIGWKNNFNSEEGQNAASESHSWSRTLTSRLSTGLVTLNLSMVLTMMAGVVRKKSSRKRRMFSRTQRSHQRDPHTDRFSLETGGIMSLNSQFSHKTDRTVNIPSCTAYSTLYVLTQAWNSHLGCLSVDEMFPHPSARP